MSFRNIGTSGDGRGRGRNAGLDASESVIFTVTSFTPDTGREGDSVDIDGTNLEYVTAVYFTGYAGTWIRATITAQATGQITVDVPAGAFTGPLRLVGPIILVTGDVFTVDDLVIDLTVETLVGMTASRTTGNTIYAQRDAHTVEPVTTADVFVDLGRGTGGGQMVLEATENERDVSDFSGDTQWGVAQQAGGDGPDGPGGLGSTDVVDVSNQIAGRQSVAGSISVSAPDAKAALLWVKRLADTAPTIITKFFSGSSWGSTTGGGDDAGPSFQTSFDGWFHGFSWHSPAGGPATSQRFYLWRVSDEALLGTFDTAVPVSPGYNTHFVSSPIAIDADEVYILVKRMVVGEALSLITAGGISLPQTVGDITFLADHYLAGSTGSYPANTLTDRIPIIDPIITDSPTAWTRPTEPGTLAPQDGDSRSVAIEPDDDEWNLYTAPFDLNSLPAQVGGMRLRPAGATPTGGGGTTTDDVQMGGYSIALGMVCVAKNGLPPVMDGATDVNALDLDAGPLGNVRDPSTNDLNLLFGFISDDSQQAANEADTLCYLDIDDVNGGYRVYAGPTTTNKAIFRGTSGPSINVGLFPRDTEIIGQIFDLNSQSGTLGNRAAGFQFFVGGARNLHGGTFRHATYGTVAAPTALRVGAALDDSMAQNRRFTILARAGAIGRSDPEAGSIMLFGDSLLTYSGHLGVSTLIYTQTEARFRLPILDISFPGYTTLDNENYWSGSDVPQKGESYLEAGIILCGINDIDDGDDGATVLASVQSLIDTVKGDNPDMLLAVFPLIPTRSTLTAGGYTAWQDFNAGIGDLTDVDYVPPSTVWDELNDGNDNLATEYEDDSHDGRHENDAGAQVIADAFRAGLVQLGVL